MKTDFSITVDSVDGGGLYYERFDTPLPVPRFGDDIFLPNKSTTDRGGGWWRVADVSWLLPQRGAMTPTMAVMIKARWSPVNERPAPVYDENLGWAEVVQ